MNGYYSRIVRVAYRSIRCHNDAGFIRPCRSEHLVAECASYHTAFRPT